MIASLVRSIRAAVMRAARRIAAFVPENLLLRQQLIVASRTAARSKFVVHDRWLAVLAARLTHRWRDALLLVEPETLLRWHRQGFRLFWRKKSRPTSTGRLSRETIALIQGMATDRADRYR